MQATKLCLLVLFISQAFAFEQYLAQVANAAAGKISLFFFFLTKRKPSCS